MALQTQSTSTPSLSLQIGPSPVGLWQKALAALDDDLKATLDFKSSTKRDILEKTLKTAEDKRQLCLRKRWKIRIRGKDVVVRDVLEKIVKWLDHFKAIGDVTAQYDPTHTALAWAGVRFLLMVSIFRLTDLIFFLKLERSSSVGHIFMALRCWGSRRCLTLSLGTQLSSACICSVTQLPALSSSLYSQDYMRSS